MSEEKKLHNLILENRQRLSVSGVTDVESFDEKSVVLDCEQGLLIVRGYDLHINKLNVESGELVIEGDMSSFNYSDEGSKKGGGLWAKMFK
jgi:sporulation protein YabP